MVGDGGGGGMRCSDETVLTCPGSAAHMSGETDTNMHARQPSALLFLRLPLAINDLFLQAGQKYDCL